MKEWNEDQALGVECLRRALRISSDVVDNLVKFEKLIVKWQRAQNLVSRETLNELWIRHIWDSARLYCIVKEPATWVDIGSGAGFPGLITAILQKEFSKESPSPVVHLIESNSRKAAFLRSVIRELDLVAKVHDDRIENSVDAIPEVQFVSARALAPLDKLFEYVEPWTSKGAHCLFHKGRDIEKELSGAANKWRFDLLEHDDWPFPDLVKQGVILEVSNLRQVS